MAQGKNYKVLLRQSSIIFLVVFAVYFAIVRPLVRQSTSMLEEQIEDTALQLERYLPKEQAGFLPTQEVLAALQKALKREEQNYQNLKKVIDPSREYLPRGAQEAGLYFIEQLHIRTKRLRRQANTLKIKIPQALGFSEEMPADRESVELLLAELDALESSATLLMEQGIKEISLLKPLRVQEQRDHQTQRVLYKELPIQLSFLCNFAVLVKVLYQLKNLSPTLAIKDIIVRKTEDSSLQVEMLLSRLALP